MRLHRVICLLWACLALTGCSALLEREYATVEPHSSKFWESEAAGTLRAENYQDIVNRVRYPVPLLFLLRVWEDE